MILGEEKRKFVYTDVMDRGTLVRKLRQMRLLERRFRGGESVLFDEFFALKEGERARYPLRTLLVLDPESRSRAFTEYLSELFSFGVADAADDTTHRIASRDAFRRLTQTLGLPPDVHVSEVRQAFRRTILEMHPDQGGDEELAQDLITLYRESFF